MTPLSRWWHAWALFFRLSHAVLVSDTTQELVKLHYVLHLLQGGGGVSLELHGDAPVIPDHPGGEVLLLRQKPLAELIPLQLEDGGTGDGGIGGVWLVGEQFEFLSKYPPSCAEAHIQGVGDEGDRNRDLLLLEREEEAPDLHFLLGERGGLPACSSSFTSLSLSGTC